MRILLSGGSGFIGRNILESFLAKKYEITAPRHAELDFTCDAAVSDLVKGGRFDFLIHSACKPGHRNAKEPGKVFYENTRMFFNLARNSRHFKRMLVIGSGAIYDMRHYRPKMKEDHFDAHVPADEHGFSKYVCGKYMEKADNMVDLRIFSIFGKYEDYAIRFISNMICKAIYDLPLTMNVNRMFDFLYVDDLMPVLDHFLLNEPGFKAYNVTPDSAVALKTVAELVLKISGKDLPIVVKGAGMDSEYSGDNSRLRAEMGGLRLTRLEDSVGKLYSWYLGNKAAIDKEFLLYDK